MPLIEWNDSLALNLQEVDAQHRELVSMVNALHDAMTEGRSKEAMGRTIDGLIDYTRSHFTLEEAYFDMFGYPDSDAHKAQHRAFVDKVKDFKQGFDEDRLFLSLDVMNFLGDWLVEHIQGSDAEYAPYLTERGVS